MFHSLFLQIENDLRDDREVVFLSLVFILERILGHLINHRLSCLDLVSVKAQNKKDNNEVRTGLHGCHPMFRSAMVHFKLSASFALTFVYILFQQEN